MKLLLLLLVAISFRDSLQTSCSFTSSNSIAKLNGNVNSVKPVPQNCGGLDCAFYITSASCLGDNGPIGGYGPLGSLGPLGTGLWSPSYWISGAFDWSDYSEKITGMGGPLSSDGPLGENGPLGDAYTDIFINDFATHLKPEGLWGVLGIAGPLGPMGGLGPLGPIGSHGYKSDDNGNFVDKHGNIVRSVQVPWDKKGTMRTYPLFEMYPSTFAMHQTLDTSFVVTGTIGDHKDTFTFTSATSQYITVLVVPIYTLDTFSLKLTGFDGKTVASADSGEFINWVQLYNNKPNHTYKVTVSLKSSLQILSHDYRLYVVGDNGYLPLSSFQGKYISQC